jgi:hypothetical protein
MYEWGGVTGDERGERGRSMGFFPVMMPLLVRELSITILNKNACYQVTD